MAAKIDDAVQKIDQAVASAGRRLYSGTFSGEGGHRINLHRAGVCKFLPPQIVNHGHDRLIAEVHRIDTRHFDYKTFLRTDFDGAGLVDGGNGNRREQRDGRTDFGLD